MSRPVRIEAVLEFLGVELQDLEQLRREGLFESDWLEPEVAEELRVATALMRELGVNAAGVDVALHLRRRLLTLEGRTERSLRRILSELDRS